MKKNKQKNSFGMQQIKAYYKSNQEKILKELNQYLKQDGIKTNLIRNQIIKLSNEEIGSRFIDNTIYYIEKQSNYLYILHTRNYSVELYTTNYYNNLYIYKCKFNLYLENICFTIE